MTDMEVRDDVDCGTGSAEPIFSLAWECDDLIQGCLRMRIRDDSQMQDSLEGYERKFTAWWEYLGVFAAKKSNLDYRLKSRPEIGDVVVRLLLILRRNLSQVIECQTNLSREGPSPAHFVQSNLGGAEDLSSLMALSLEAIGESLVELGRVAIAIRQSSRTTETVRARRFVSRHLDLSRHLTSFEALAYLALETLYPNASESLVVQLSKSMADRFARILFRAPRHAVLKKDIRQQGPNAVPDSRARPVNAMSPQVGQNAGVAGQLNSLTDRARHAPPTIALSSVNLSQFQDKLRLLRTPKSHSGTTVLLAKNHEPPVPHFGESGETECRWCFASISPNLVQDGCWTTQGREHYCKDLEPFCCIWADCTEPVREFSSVKGWSEHMLQHHSSWAQYAHRKQMWRCDLGNMHSSEALFSTPDHLCGHVKALHADTCGTMDDVSIRALAQASVLNDLRMPNVCPLCCLIPRGMESVYYPSEQSIPIPKAMENHIAEHLRNLMVLSLQLMETQNEELDGDNTGGSMTPDRSQLESLTDHSEVTSNSDWLPSPPHGSPTIRPAFTTLEDGEPPETDAEDWFMVTDETRRQKPELQDDKDSILIDLRARQRKSPEELNSTSRSLEKSHDLLGMETNVVVSLDLRGTILWVSESWIHVIGTLPEAVQGQAIARIIVSNNNVFARATEKMRRDNSKSQHVGFSVRLGPLAKITEDPTGSRVLDLEGQGMMIQERREIIWTIRPWISPAKLRIGLPQELTSALGSGAERLDSYLTEVLESGTKISSSTLLSSILCHTCEQSIQPSWWFERHTELCPQENRAEMDIQSAQRDLIEHRKAIVKILDSLEGMTKPPLHQAKYKGMPIETSSSRSMPATEGQASFAIRRPTQRNVELLLDLLDTAMEIETPEIRWSETSDGLHTQSSQSKFRIEQVMQWQGLSAGSLEGQRGLELLSTDTERLSRAKVHATLRHMKIIEYVERVRIEAVFMAQDVIDATVQRAAAGSLSASSSPSVQSSTARDPPKTHAKPMSLRDFEIIKPISKGVFASVYLSKRKSTREYFAIKVVKKADMEAKNRISNIQSEQAFSMWPGEGDFVAKVFWTFSSKNYLYLITEYLSGGDCAALINVIGGLLEDWARNYICEIILGVEHLHKQGIIHRDLRPGNVIIDGKGRLKLTDFGLSSSGLALRHRLALSCNVAAIPNSPLSQVSNTEGLAEEHRVPLPASSLPRRPVESFYLAPEVIRGESQDEGVDWWSLGCMIYEFILGIPPFHAGETEQVVELILARRFDWPDETDICDVSPEAKDVVNRLLVLDPKERLGSNRLGKFHSGGEEIRAHPWFLPINWETLLQGDTQFVPQPENPEDTEYFDPRGATLQSIAEEIEDQQVEVEDDDQRWFCCGGKAERWHSNSYNPATDASPACFQCGHTKCDTCETTAEYDRRRVKTSGSKHHHRSQHPAHLSSLLDSNKEMTTPPPPSPTPSTRNSQTFDMSSSPEDDEADGIDDDRKGSRLAKVQGRPEGFRLRPVSVSTEGKYRALDVLICEDHPVSRMVMEKLIEKLHCRSISASTGAEAVRYAMSDIMFDIIITELKLPAINGTDVARMIRETKNANSNTPIVAVSTYLKELQLPHCFAALVEKPITSSKLTELLCNLCSWKPAGLLDPPLDGLQIDKILSPEPRSYASQSIDTFPEDPVGSHLFGTFGDSDSASVKSAETEDDNPITIGETRSGRQAHQGKLEAITIPRSGGKARRHSQ